MGAWGVDLFADDTAADVRAHYRELIEDGVEDIEATQHVVAHFQERLDDEDDGPLVWLALAVSQSQIGRLAPEVRDKALSVIETGADLERWTQEPLMLEQRRVVLAKAREQLVGAQPKRTKLRRPRMRYVTDLHAGDVLSYRGSNGRMAVVRVARIDRNRGSVAPILKVLEYCGTLSRLAQASLHFPTVSSATLSLHEVPLLPGGQLITDPRPTPEWTTTRPDSVASPTSA